MKQYTEGWCRSGDGTNIFFSVLGPGRPTTEPDVLLCDGVGCDGFVWKYLIPVLAERHRVIRHHYRGHGRSAVPCDLERLGMDDIVDDLTAVLDHTGVERPAVLAGHSMGVQVILEAHRRIPERVAALVPTCGSYGNPLDTFHDGEYLKKTFPYLYRLFTGFPEAAMRLWRALLPSPLAYWAALAAGEVNRSLMRMEDMQPYFEHLGRMNAEVFVRMLHLISAHTVRDHLPLIDVPTLVIAAENDTFTPAWLSREMAELIPEAELLMIQKGSHAAPLEQPDLIALRIEKFLTDRFGCYQPRAMKPRLVPAEPSRQSSPADEAVAPRRSKVETKPAKKRAGPRKKKSPTTKKKAAGGATKRGARRKAGAAKRATAKKIRKTQSD